jgi:hypothetical protein
MSWIKEMVESPIVSQNFWKKVGFLWGDTIERKKLHLIKWETVSRPKDEEAWV